MFEDRKSKPPEWHAFNGELYRLTFSRTYCLSSLAYEFQSRAFMIVFWNLDKYINAERKNSVEQRTEKKDKRLLKRKTQLVWSKWSCYMKWGTVGRLNQHGSRSEDDRKSKSCYNFTTILYTLCILQDRGSFCNPLILKPDTYAATPKVT